jgi:hypothetical protein
MGHGGFEVNRKAFQAVGYWSQRGMLVLWEIYLNPGREGAEIA